MMRTTVKMVRIPNGKGGFILSLEPAISLLLLLSFIFFIYTHLYLPFQDYSQVIEQMHETDVWLVEDSIHYYNNTEKLKAQNEWLKKELVSRD